MGYSLTEVIERQHLIISSNTAAFPGILCSIILRGWGVFGKKDPEEGLHNWVGWAMSHTDSVTRTKMHFKGNINAILADMDQLIKTSSKNSKFIEC